MRQGERDPQNPVVKRAVDFANRLIEFPRHLSQHVGGFVLTRDKLDWTVPIGPAAMDERYFIEWDKDDLDTLEIMKVDVLALGMLTCIRKAFRLIDSYTYGGAPPLELAGVPKEDPAVYDMLCDADAIGVFQVESRAQMNMLPRLRPREFYDLVVEVAIVRPGPIQGGMVHPYLKRREALRKNPGMEFPYPQPTTGPQDADELKFVLNKTLGIPLFQEQAMKLAIVAAKFSGNQANGLRRAMATFRNLGTIDQYKELFVGGMTKRGYEEDFAQACFRQIEGFGSYGFPESHAASFALLVYISAWIKKHHPAAFAAALLNSQPMGFYAPAEIVRDAREHRVQGAAARCRFQRLGFHPGTRQQGRDLPAPGVAPDRWHQASRCRRHHGQSRLWLSRLCGLCATHRLAETRFGHSGGSRRLSRFRARSPRGSLGGAPLARRQAAAFVCAAIGARSGRGTDRAPARDGPVGTCPHRLPDHPAVAERLSHTVLAAALR